MSRQPKTGPANVGGATSTTAPASLAWQVTTTPPGEGQRLPPRFGHLCLELPYPPSANHSYRRGRGGRVVLTEAARAYPELVQAAVFEQLGRPVRLPDGAGDIMLFLQVCPPDRRRRDLDNTINRLQNALAAVLGFDDSRITDLRVTMLGVVRGGRVHATLYWTDYGGQRAAGAIGTA